MIGVPTAWIAGGTLVAGLGAGFWVGHEMGAARYLDGLHAGIKSQQKISDAEMARMLAETRAEAENVRRVASEQAKEQEGRYEARIQSAKESADIQHAATVAAADRLRTRLRSLERSANRLPNSAGGVPEATTVATDEPSLTDWLVSERGGRRIVRLAQRAEETLTDLLSCRDGWPVSEASERSGSRPPAP